MPSPIDPTNPPSTEEDLDVRGSLPLALAGRLVAIGRDGLNHSFHLHGGRVSHIARGIRTGVPSVQAIMDVIQVVRTEQPVSTR